MANCLTWWTQDTPTSHLSVLSVAYPFAPVRPDPVGGAEQSASMLDSHLVKSGHKSSVIATSSSRVKGTLIPVATPRGTIDDRAHAAVAALYRQALIERLAARDIDIVHFHGIDFMDYLPATRVPRVVTLHLPLAWYPHEAFSAPDLQRVCVSYSQRSTAPTGSSMTVIENGVELERYHVRGSKQPFALLLARVCPEKGIDVAIRAARRAGIRLIIAGKLFPYPEHERYHRDVVTPLLDSDRRFVGPVEGATKRDLLAAARCVLIPSQVNETSSLVAMEALASGTPVIATRRGALPEIVEHGRTGLIVDDEVQMADAIDTVRQITAADCRAAAEARFSATVMANRYVELYASCVTMRQRPLRSALEVEEIRDDDHLAALENEWDALFERCLDATPFQSPCWVLAARRHLSGGAELRALAVRHGGRLVGLLPLEATDGTLRCVGAAVSDYLDALFEPHLACSVLSAMTLHLHANHSAWQALELTRLRAESPLLELALPSGWSDAVSSDEPWPVLRLPTAMADRIAYDRRRLARSGRVAWRSSDDGDPADLVRALIDLHSARWQSRGENGVLAHPAVQRFHRDVAPALARRGMLWMHALVLDGRIVAVLYGFVHRRRCYYYLSGFAPDVARLSPGVVLVAHAIDEAQAAGMGELDFLRGREPYKYRWGARDRPAFARSIRHG